MKFDQSPDVKNADNFLKIKDGESVKGVFRGEPETFYVYWEGKKSVECEPTHEKARFRFRINFVTRGKDGNLVSKIWDQGPTIYNALKDLNLEYELADTVVNIKRTGSGLNDTSYSVIPAKENKLPPGLDEVLLNDLKSKPTTSAYAEAPAFDSEEEIPF